MFIISSCNVLNLDGSKPVFEVIDNDANNAESIPINSWLTQLGQVTTAPGGSNSATDRCEGVSVDSKGNTYCAGYTNSSMGEANSGVDAFVMKLDQNGNLVWLTQLGQVTQAQGGSNAGDDRCYGVSTDFDGNVYCAGSTTGAMGEANAGGEDAFVMKLDTNGNIVGLTQLGQTTRTQTGNNVGNDECHGVSTDSDGNVYCAGSTEGAMGEANAGSDDAFVMKLDTNGNLVWLTQLGQVTTAPGGSNTGLDKCSGVSTDSSGNVYCAGYTTGSMGETHGGSGDAFVMKLDTNGNLVWLTHFGQVTQAQGGSNADNEACHGVSIDSSGNVYCGGKTDGSMGETRGGGFNPDAFILKLEPDGIFNP